MSTMDSAPLHGIVVLTARAMLFQVPGLGSAHTARSAPLR